MKEKNDNLVKRASYFYAGVICGVGTYIGAALAYEYWAPAPLAVSLGLGIATVEMFKRSFKHSDKTL